MAGEIEEPSSFSFQADSFRSGSVSFGRYENELLSWERRSSFSHNRYLEEVEKCSKPGSVIEKKAYFEAHFKKAALRHQNSSESQNARDYGTSDNELLENMNGREECDNMNKSSESTYANGGSLGNLNYWEDNNGEERNESNYVDDAGHSARFKEELGNVDYGEEFDRGNGRGQYRYLGESGKHGACYSKSPKGLEQLKECEVAVCGVENIMVFPSDLEIEGSMSKSNSCIDGLTKDGARETNQTEICTGKLLVDDGESEMEVGQKADNICVNFESSGPLNSSPKNNMAKKVDKSCVEHHRIHSAKLMAGKASKSTKPALKSHVSTVAKGSSSDPSKKFAKNQNIMERESQQRAKKEKLPSRAEISTRQPLNRIAKKEDTGIMETKQNIEGRSEKAIRMKKVTEPQSSASKVELRAHQSPNRLKYAVASTKLDTRTISSTFNFKNSERAERRKEFYKKLEKEMHSKEAEMNQFQAIPGDASSKRKPGKVQKKLNTGAAARLTPLFKAGSDRTLLATKSLSSTDHPKGHALPSIPPTNANSRAEAITKDGIVGKKERGKIKELLVPHDNKMMTDLKVRGKLKVGARRNDNEVASKQMRG